MKTNIYDAPIYSLISLFVILTIGGTLAFYPQHATGVKNEATPAGLTQKDADIHPNQNNAMEQNIEQNIQITPPVNEDQSSGNSTDVHPEKIQLN